MKDLRDGWGGASQLSNVCRVLRPSNVANKQIFRPRNSQNAIEKMSGARSESKLFFPWSHQKETDKTEKEAHFLKDGFSTKTVAKYYFLG